MAIPYCFHGWCDRFNDVFKTLLFKKLSLETKIGELLEESQRRNLSQMSNNTVGLSYQKSRHFLVRGNWSIDSVLGASSLSDVGMSSNKTFWILSL
ncbi:MAG: hypothetical protein O4860_02360 [Trichodesmium sp. St2_bin2_1]|nr:hypothetical protein [Trichodesmium sp. St2_bin2_1]